jgi:hypothetical protein
MRSASGAFFRSSSSWIELDGYKQTRGGAYLRSTPGQALGQRVDFGEQVEAAWFANEHAAQPTSRN